MGTEGDELLKGTDGDDVIVGRGGNDRLVGGDGNDTLCGYAGDDVLVGGSGDDVMIGGRGSDWVAYGLAPNGVSVSLRSGSASGWGQDRLFTIENVAGSPFDDELVGNDEPNVMKGRAGSDQVDGHGGDDHLFGGRGYFDELFGGGGDDVLRGGADSDRLSGGDGDDLLLGGSDDDDLEPGAGNDIVHGGPGANAVRYMSERSGVTINLLTGTAIGAGNDTLVGITHALGSGGDDVIIGNGDYNGLYGYTGNDLIRGRRGHDVLDGGDGRDTLIGGEGNDDLWGSHGDDIVRGGPGNDLLSGSIGDDYLYGNGGDDDLYGEDTVPGDAFTYSDDHLYGGHGNDEIYGGYGDDFLDGGDGVDLLDGSHDFDECIRGEIYRSCELITNRWLTFDASEWVGRTVTRTTSAINGFDHVVVDGQVQEDLLAQQGGAVAPWDHERSTGAFAWFVSMVPEDAVEPPDFGRTMVWLVEESDQGVVLDALGLITSPGKEIEYCWQVSPAGAAWPLVIWVGAYGWAASPPPEYSSAFDLTQLECSAG